MANARLVEKSELGPQRRRTTNPNIHKAREVARDLLRQAREGDQAIELSLTPRERDETIKARYRTVAKEEQLSVRFQTGKRRTYRNRTGREEYEAEVLYVLVE